MDSVTATYVREANDDLIQIRTIRKVYFFKGSNKDECIEWINAINERKNMSIKERMGHAKVDSSIVQINRIGNILFEGKITKEGRSVNQDPVMNPMFGY